MTLDTLSDTARSLLALCAFLCFTGFWVIVVSALSIVYFGVLFALGEVDYQTFLVLDPKQSTEVISELIGPGFMGLTAIVQTGGLALSAAVLCLILADRVTPVATTYGQRISRALALPTPHWAWLLAGLLTGGLVGFLPGWIAAELSSALNYEGNLDLIGRVFQTGSVAGKLTMVIAVAISAPLFEEVIFRGFVYRAIETAFPRTDHGTRLGGLAALLGSTVLFAAYHMDPVHVVSLLPTALILGVLRWQSGSLWPCVAAHFVNNALATVAIFATLEEPSEQLSLVVALGTQCAAWMVVAGAWALSSRTRQG